MFHRVEKNATNWSKERIKELLAGLKVEHEKGRIVTENVSDIKIFFPHVLQDIRNVNRIIMKTVVFRLCCICYWEV